MKTPIVTLIDYGIGNIFSVRRAFEFSGAKVVITSDPDEILNSDRLVLPGVGAFKVGMAELKNRNLETALQHYAKKGRPLMGICLGMQLLADESEEFGTTQGLGIIPGRVKRIPEVSKDGKPMKVPHVAWDSLCLPEGLSTWKNTPLESARPGDAVYLVHSFAFNPSREANRLADVEYGGNKVTAAVYSENVMGFQFHPERSGHVGLRIIDHFIKQ